MACSCWVTTILLVAFVSVRSTSGQGDNLHASCVVDPETGSGAENISGTIMFTQPKGGNISITVKLSGFNAANNGSKHGFHVHAKGDLGNQCKDAGGHYNPHAKDHAGPQDADRHVGDLGNVIQGSNGMIDTVISDAMVSIEGEYSVIGKAMVIHEGEDDLGRGGFSDSKTTGHAGARLGCCVIAESKTPDMRENSAAGCVPLT